MHGRKGCQNPFMPAIEKEALGDAVVAVGRMDLKQKEMLADAIHDSQPTLLYAVLAQQRLGVNYEQLDVLINILLVFHLAMVNSGHRWKKIDEALQERCLTRVKARIKFLEGLAPDLVRQSVHDAIAASKEPWLLAFVYGSLREHGMADIKDDAERQVLLVALTLVDCTREAGRATR